MSRLTLKKNNETRRAHRVRTMVTTSPDRFRLSVFISNRHIYAQIIDDTKGKTVASASTAKVKKTGTMTAQAELVGQEIAKKAKTKKVKKVAFDRGSKLYHGRIKALADAARAEGLEF